MMTRRFVAFLVLGAFAWAWSGCQPVTGTVLGKAPTEEPRTILAIRDGLTPPNVTIRGRIVEKCPTAGCWFYVEDGTGVLKVDTKSAGFGVTELALQTEVTVGGKLIQEGEETVLDAAGLRY